jgi:diadenosine tetraphosphatase ApaH/serine/threonine PP2A family protein phosphatase
VRDLADLVILGNHDAACAGRLSTEWFNTAARAAVEGHRHMLERAHIHWLAELPYRIELDDMLLCHGSPYHQEDFPYVLDEADVATIMQQGGAVQPLIFVGHTHRGTTFICRPRPALQIREEPHTPLQALPEHRYVFNVGSVGQPRDGDWRACFGIFDTETRVFELRRAEYDVDSASEKIARLGFPTTLSERLFLGL